jgi:hypothetical protein
MYLKNLNIFENIYAKKNVKKLLQIVKKKIQISYKKKYYQMKIK